VRVPYEATYVFFFPASPEATPAAALATR
jgi:hypothetical protein